MTRFLEQATAFFFLHQGISFVGPIKLWMIRRILLIFATVGMVAITPQAAAAQRCDFRFGFASLKAAIGAAMGSALTCEYADPHGTGDVEQNTTSGLAFWRKSTNTPTFTDGWSHWALTSTGLVTWTGSSIDPPGTAALSAPPTASITPARPPQTAPAPVTVCAVADSQRNNALIISGGGALDICIDAKSYLATHTLREWTVIDNTQRNKYLGAFNTSAPQVYVQCTLTRGDISVEVDYASNASPWSAEWCTARSPLNDLP
jgi:hypothetical protein